MVNSNVNYINSDTREIDSKLPRREACFSTFLSHYRTGRSKKYLIIYFNPFPDFKIKEVKSVMDTLKMSYTLKMVKLNSSLDQYFNKGVEYPIITLDTTKYSLAQIKLFYHILRYFFESKSMVNIMKKSLEFKKYKPKVHILNAILYCSLFTENGTGHQIMYRFSFSNQSSLKLHRYSELFKLISNKDTYEDFIQRSVKPKSETSIKKIVKLYEESKYIIKNE